MEREFNISIYNDKSYYSDELITPVRDLLVRQIGCPITPI